jgi:hypothetical protein
MSNFPLFDSLNKDLPKKDLSINEKEECVNKIQNIDSIGRDLIYALIQFYSISEEKIQNSDELPYKGTTKEITKGVQNLTWTFTDFPIKLRHILYKFIKVHTQSIEEDQALRNKIA